MQNRWLHIAPAILIAATLSFPSQISAQNISAQVKEHMANIQHDLRANDLAGAEREYREIVDLDPSNSEAWTGLGVLLYGQGKAEAAASALSSALKINPLEKRAELFLGLSEADLRQCDRAIPILERHFDTEPVGKLQRLTGLALLSCASTATDAMPALKIATKLKSLYPDDPDVLYESAELDTRLWDQDAGQLIAKHPDSYRVHQLAGEVYEAQDNAEQAIREYKIALEENPKLPQMHYRIGQMYLHEGGPDADQNAMVEFHDELTVDPESAVSTLALGEIYRHQHKLDEALVQYKLASHLDPGLVEAQVGLAQVLLAEHQVDASIDQLHGVIQQHPDNAQAHYALMLAYRQQGKVAEADQEMETFKKLQQSNAEHFDEKLNALLHNKAQSHDISPQ